VATETVTNLIFTGPLAWTVDAECVGQTDLFFAPAGLSGPRPGCCGRPEPGPSASTVSSSHPVASGPGSTGSTGSGGASPKRNAPPPGTASTCPVGRVARYPKGNGQPVQPREPRVA